MRTHWRREHVASSVALGALVLALAHSPGLQAGEKKLRAAEFSLKSLNGNVVELADLLGKGPVIINFWATWCKPCIKELPHLQKIHDEFRDVGLEVVAISEDSPWSVSKVKSFISGNRYTFLVLLDTNGKTMRRYGLLGTPYTILVSPAGEILYKHFGYRPGDENALREEIRRFLTLDGGDDGEEPSEESASGG